MARRAGNPLTLKAPFVPAMPDPHEFRDTVAVITGGTDGLGEHLGLTLAALGTQVFVCGRRQEMGRRFERRAQGRGHFVRCDLRDVRQTRQFVQTAGDFRGRIDYLVNNAAIDPNIPFGKMTLDQFMEVWEICLKSYVVVTKAALPYLKKSSGRAIVNMGTTNYMKGIEGMTAYNAAKSGIVGFTRSLARDLGRRLDVRVNQVSPGWTMTARQMRDAIRAPQRRYLFDSQALKKLMFPAHITPAVIFLLSQASGGITGQNLVVDGGQIMQ
jgi:D-xylose 1-dehydrogenase